MISRLHERRRGSDPALVSADDQMCQILNVCKRKTINWSTEINLLRVSEDFSRKACLMSYVI